MLNPKLYYACELMILCHCFSNCNLHITDMWKGYYAILWVNIMHRLFKIIFKRFWKIIGIYQHDDISIISRHVIDVIDDILAGKYELYDSMTKWSVKWLLSFKFCSLKISYYILTIHLKGEILWVFEIKFWSLESGRWIIMIKIKVPHSSFWPKWQSRLTPEIQKWFWYGKVLLANSEYPSFIWCHSRVCKSI